MSKQLSRAAARQIIAKMSETEQRHSFDKLSKQYFSMLKSGAVSENIIFGWQQYKKKRNEEAYADARQTGTGAISGKRVPGSVTAEEEDEFRTSLNIRELHPLKFNQKIWDETPHGEKTMTSAGGSGGGAMDQPITERMLMGTFGFQDRTMEQSAKLRERFSKYPSMSELASIAPPMLKHNLQITTSALATKNKAGTFLTGAPGGGKSYIFESYYSLLAAGLALHAKYLWWQDNQQDAFIEANARKFPIREQRIYHTMAESFGSDTAYRGQSKKPMNALGVLVESNQDQIIMVLDELYAAIEAGEKGDQSAREATANIKTYILRNYGSTNLGPRGRAKMIPVMATENIRDFVEKEGHKDGMFNDQIERRMGRESDQPGANLSPQAKKMAAFSELKKEEWTIQSVEAFIKRAVKGWLFNKNINFTEAKDMTDEVRSIARAEQAEAIQKFSNVFFERKFEGPGGYGSLEPEKRPGLGAETAKAFIANVVDNAYSARINDTQYKLLARDNQAISQAQKGVEEFKVGLKNILEQLKGKGLTFQQVQPLLGLRPDSFDDAAIDDFVENKISVEIKAILDSMFKSGSSRVKVVKAVSARKPKSSGDPLTDVEDDVPATEEAVPETMPTPKPQTTGPVVEEDVEYKDIQQNQARIELEELLKDFVEINLNKIAENANLERVTGEKDQRIYHIIQRYQNGVPSEYQGQFDEVNLSDFALLKMCDVYNGYINRSSEETNAAAAELEAMQSKGEGATASFEEGMYEH